MNAPTIFTRSELKVAALLARGQINKEIAHTFGVTEATIKAHVSSFMKKAGLERPTRVNAAMAYLRLCDEAERDEIIGGPARVRGRVDDAAQQQLHPQAHLEAVSA